MSIRKDKDFMKLLREYHRLIHNIIPGASCVLDIMNKQDELINYIDDYLCDAAHQKKDKQIEREIECLMEESRARQDILRLWCKHFGFKLGL